MTNVSLSGSGAGCRVAFQALRYLEVLSSEHTLGLARSWIGESDGRGQAARGILEHHAEECDLPVLIGGLGDAWGVRDFYAICSFVDALARVPCPESAETIVSIYEGAEYSYARRRAARALVDIDEQAFANRFARSALWDCEHDVQDLAVGVLGYQVDEVAAVQIVRLQVQR